MADLAAAASVPRAQTTRTGSRCSAGCSRRRRLPAAPPPKPAAAAKPAPAPKPTPKPPAKSPEPPKRTVAKLRELPNYTRSLLRIEVPVIVTLAENRLPLHRIVELGPGSMIQFEKSCEDMLELSIGDRRVAEGEAVKVGDKFGLRITSIVLPEERFRPVRAGKK